MTVPRPLPYRRDDAWRTVVDWLTTRAESYEQDARLVTQSAKREDEAAG